jgi:hypothetical protein
MPNRILSVRKVRAEKKPSGESAWEKAIIQPWFLPHATSVEILRLLPRHWKKRMRYYFDYYGCLRCDRKDLMHGGNGFCTKCHEIVSRRLMFTARRQFKKPPAGEAYPGLTEFLSAPKLARQLLRGLVQGRRSAKKSFHIEPRVSNPARQLLGMSANCRLKA